MWFGAGAVLHSDPGLKLMTYNLFWEALQAENSMSHCSPCKECDNKCVQNIARVVASFEPDVLTLQEIRKDSEKQWGTLHAALTKVMPSFDDRYGYTYTTRLPVAGVMTLYNKDKLHVKYTVEGNFLTDANSERVIPGRPFLITVFKEPLIVINVHFPHLTQLKPPHNTRASFIAHLRTVLRRDVPESGDAAYHFVIAGDFNLDDIPANRVQTELSVVQHLTSKRVYGPPALVRTVDRNAAGCYDHILTTIRPFDTYFTLPVKLQQSMKNYMSDHLPIMATVGARLRV